MERVRIVQGKTQAIIVAPHGVNDERTALIAERIARRTNSFAVLNTGWERSNKVDCMMDKADCNNVNHCLEDVVKEEFLDPIIRFKNRIVNSKKEAYIFYIHGMSNRHRIIANDPTMDIVIGFGEGIPNSITFDMWKKDFLIECLEDMGFGTYQSSQGGLMSGWSKNNMNQFFRKWYYESNVNSLQIELVHEIRESDRAAERTADYLADALSEAIVTKKFNLASINKVY